MSQPDPQARLRAIAVRRLRLIPVAGRGVDTRRKVVLLAELARLGYAVDDPEGYDDSALDHHDELIATLREMKGGHVDYVPLFQGFPDAVPDGDEYFVKRVIGYLGDELPLFEDGRVIEGGWRVPEWLFDLDQFGADPITQRQTEELFRAGVARQAEREADARTEWTRLRFADWDAVTEAARGWLQDALYARSSIKEALREDIETLLDRFGAEGLDPARVVFKETRTYLLAWFWRRGDLAAVTRLADTATDVLRLFAALTGTDVSLAEKIEFPRLRRAERRAVLGVLEASAGLEEDVRAYAGLWKELGRWLHPGEHAARFPRAAKAFDALRNGRLQTWLGGVEQAARERNLGGLLARLGERPGVFARRLHQALEIAGSEHERVLAAFDAVADRVALKNLLVMQSHFRTIERSERRAIINKRGRIRVMENRRGRISADANGALLDLLERVILRKIAAEKPSWEGRRVFIDPALRDYTVPLQQRKASEGLLSLGRGSRLPLADGKVLRLFVWWKDEPGRDTDLDLSLISYDDEMGYTGHVSYTNLAADGIVHSGDLQSAPHGAAEFVDIELARVRERAGCRYLAAQIHRYCGDRFGAIDCHAGWMIRDDDDHRYESFDIKTVQNKLDLTGTAGYAIPIVVDIEAGRVIYVDLYVNGVGQYNRVEGSFQDTSTITRELARMIDTRPNMLDLARYHARARGATEVQSAEAADVRFGLTGCDYAVDRIERTLAELL